MSFFSLSSCQLRQLVVVAVVVVISATIGETSGAASRRLHRWEHDVPSTTADCVGSDEVTTIHDKLTLISKRPNSSVQLQIRCNLPVSYDRDTQAT